MNHKRGRRASSTAKLAAEAVSVTAMILSAWCSQAERSLNTGWILQNNAVLEDAFALTKTLGREVTVYHWVERGLVSKEFAGSILPAVGFVNVRAPALIEAVERNLETRMERFWDLSVPVSGRAEDGGAMAPNGLYVATEPIISRSYGGRNWLLVELRLPAGTRFIDGRYRHGALGTHLVEALESRGCRNPLPVQGRDTVFAARNLLKADTHQVSCRRSLNEIAAATGSSALLYIFKREPVPACRAVFEWNAAFVLVDSAGVEVGSAQPFIPETAPQDDGLDARRSLLNRVFEHSGLGRLFPTIAVSKDEEMRRLLREQYFACNPDVREW